MASFTIRGCFAGILSRWRSFCNPAKAVQRSLLEVRELENRIVPCTYTGPFPPTTLAQRQQLAEQGYCQYANGDAAGGRYSLLVAYNDGNNGVIPDVTRLPRANADDLAKYIQFATTPTGIVRNSLDLGAHPGGGQAFGIEWYFSAMSLIGFLGGPDVVGVNKQLVVRNHILAHLDKLKTDGTMDYIWINSSGVEVLPRTKTDGDDSTASTLLLLAWKYYEVTQDKTLFEIPGVQEKLNRVAGLLYRLQDPSTGLTRAVIDSTSPYYSTFYLQDNAESAAGFTAFANMSRYIFSNAFNSHFFNMAAANVKRGIHNSLFNTSTNLYDWANASPIDPAKWYPGALNLIWPTLFGVEPPDSVRSVTAQSRINANWDGIARQHWTTRTDASSMGYFAKLRGDASNAQGAFTNVTQGPFPTFSSSPNVDSGIGYPKGLTTISDWGFALLLSKSGQPSQSWFDPYMKPPAQTKLYATGAGAGGGPHVRVFNANGTERFSFLAYAANFTGGVRVATGDIDGDGVDDIVTAAGAGGGPHIRVFSGVNGALIRDFFAYDQNFRGGVFVAVGDVNGDGIADIVTGAGAGGGPHVHVFDGFTSSSPVIRSFFAYGMTFTGGVSVGVGDVNGDHYGDIITGAGAGGGPHVKVFDVFNTANQTLFDFLAYDPSFRGGVNVAASDLNNDGRADLFTAAGPGGGPHVQVFDGKTRTLLRSFLAYDGSFTGGVSITGRDLNNDGWSEIITGAGPGGGPNLRIFQGTSTALTTNLNVYANNFPGGIFVG